VDITWFYQGLEEFSKIVARNFVIKIINVVYIFCVVKSKNDLTLYVFGKAFFEFLGNASLWSYLPKYVEKPDFKCIKPLRNIKLVSALFIPTIAIKIYTVLDKTMIGVITNDSFENGYYEQAIKISKITLSVVTSLGNVMIPRIGFYHGRNETEKVKNFMYKSYRFVWIMGIPLCFGLIGISSNFVPWFFGYGYEKVIFLIRVLAFLILAIGVNNVTGGQYLIPTKRENIYTLTVIIGAVVNFGLNLCLIQFFKSIGAAVASVIAESVIAVTQLFIVRKELSVKKIIKSSWHYWIAGLIMLILLMYMSAVLSPTIVHTIFMVICGAITYGVFLCIMKDEFLINNLKDMYIRFSGKWNVR
jgi:O-antigen/teichoic acid export membrane protein